MKKIYTIIAGLMLTASVFAQVPEKMSYQAVIRNASNALVASTAVGMQISILQGNASGSSVYTETHTPTTNINGLVSLEIGSGTSSDDFSTIDWAAGPYFIKTETDPTTAGGTNYTITGTTQLMSVPYALHAKTAESITGTVTYTETDPIFGASIANGITAIDTANWNNHTIDTDTQLDSTGVASLGFVAGAHTIDTDTHLDETAVDAFVANNGYLTSFTEVDGSITNEIQTISRTGTTVTLTNGGGTFSDSVNTYTAGTGISITGNVISTLGACNLSIGDTYQGGIIFYLDATGCHGLISALTDQSTGVQWYNGTYRLTGTTGDGTYAGEMNTTMIVASQLADNQNGFFAAKTCADYSFYSNVLYGDWYLPSRSELGLMYDNIGQGNVLGLGNVGSFIDGYYWSSTEFNGDVNLAWGYHFTMIGSWEIPNKNSSYYVRAVRDF